MDFIPKKVLQELEVRLNAPTPPPESSSDPNGSVISFAGLRLAWWLETLLRAGASEFQGLFRTRPPEEMRAMAIQLGRHFLHRPLLQRLAPTGIQRPAGDRWVLAREGSLLLLHRGKTDEAVTGIYYLLPHRQIWPALGECLDWASLLGPDEWKALGEDRTFSARSGREEVRARVETLRRWTAASPAALTPEREGLPQAPAGAAAPSPVKPRGRKRKPSGQMSLFEENDTSPHQ